MDDRRLLAARQIDRLYGLRKTTAATAARAGLVRAVTRPGRGRYRIVILIDTDDAERQWGGRSLATVSPKASR